MRGAALVLAASLGACQPAPPRPATPAPRACELESFENAPGVVLPSPPPLEPQAKGEPLQFAGSIPVRRGVTDLGAWVEAAPGWRAWRLWLRSEEARSLSVHLRPLALPPGAELWLCSPDRTTRRGPITGKGPGDTGQYWAPAVDGPELWLEVLAPASSESAVRLTITRAFAGSD